MFYEYRRTEIGMAKINYLRNCIKGVDKKCPMCYNAYMDEREEIIVPKCPKCGSMDGQMYSGFSKSGARRCVCRKCKHKYTLNRKYPKAFKEEAIRLYKVGLSAREVGKILKINKGSVLNWVREAQNDLEKI